MPSAWWNLCQEIENYLKECKEERNYSPFTIRNYRYALERQFKALKDEKMTTNPRKIGKEELFFLRDVHFTELATPKYKWHMISQLVCFCKWAGNTNITKIRMIYGDTSRTHVRWLNEDEVLTVMKNVETSLEELIIHCELGLGMRRIEVQRLRLESFHFGRENYVSIQGKGRNGGKYRRVPLRKDTRAIVEEFLEYRKNIVRGHEDCGFLVVHNWNCSPKPYGKTGIDKILEHLSKRTGVKFSNHDLRRTFGRRMFRSGVPIEEIASILGHEDTKTTLKYLGLDHDDLSHAMDKLYQYDQKTIFPKMEIFDDSQEK
ncbi:MAG: site-specific integrase, partial [Candidatus Thorarchaeota archaeon]